MRVVVLLTCWVVGLGIGVHTMFNYQLTPGMSANPPNCWNQNPLVSLDTQRPTLLVFAHPKCPCTKATIRELERLVTVTKNLASTHVVFFQPTDMADNWVKTDLWHHAQAIPGVTAIPDYDGQLAKQFNINTSGTAVLYAANGKQIFNGGITSSRGHEGDNTGSSTIRNLLTGTDAVCSSTPVFGCALHNLNSNTDESNHEPTQSR